MFKTQSYKYDNFCSQFTYSWVSWLVIEVGRNINLNFENGRYSGKCWFCLSDQVKARMPILIYIWISSQDDIREKGDFVILIMYKSEYRYEYRSEFRARSIFKKMVISSFRSCIRAKTDLNIDLNFEPGRYSGKLWVCLSDHVLGQIPIWI